MIKYSQVFSFSSVKQNELDHWKINSFEETSVSARREKILSFVKCQVFYCQLYTHMLWHIYRSAEAMLCLGAQTDCELNQLIPLQVWICIFISQGQYLLVEHITENYFLTSWYVSDCTSLILPIQAFISFQRATVMSRCQYLNIWLGGN